jgi:hypothetical protein
MQHVKINDVLEFPLEIDFRPWTDDGVNVEENNSKDEENQSQELIGCYSENEAISEETPQN